MPTDAPKLFNLDTDCERCSKVVFKTLQACLLAPGVTDKLSLTPFYIFGDTGRLESGDTLGLSLAIAHLARRRRCRRRRRLNLAPQEHL